MWAFVVQCQTCGIVLHNKRNGSLKATKLTNYDYTKYLLFTKPTYKIFPQEKYSRGHCEIFSTPCKVIPNTEKEVSLVLLKTVSWLKFINALLKDKIFSSKSSQCSEFSSNFAGEKLFLHLGTDNVHRQISICNFCTK